MKVAIDKLSNGTVWTFRPTSKKASRLMHKLFPRALWSGNGDRMLVEHRYEIQIADCLTRQGVFLIRESDSEPLRVCAGHFVLDENLKKVLASIGDPS